MLIKPLAEEIDLSVDSDVGNAKYVRLLNTGAAAISVTVKDDGTTVASLSIAPGEVVYLTKAFAETLVATSAVKAVKVAYSG